MIALTTGIQKISDDIWILNGQYYLLDPNEHLQLVYQPSGSIEGFYVINESGIITRKLSPQAIH